MVWVHWFLSEYNDFLWFKGCTSTCGKTKLRNSSWVYSMFTYFQSLFNYAGNKNGSARWKNDLGNEKSFKLCHSEPMFWLTNLPFQCDIFPMLMSLLVKELGCIGIWVVVWGPYRPPVQFGALPDWVSCPTDEVIHRSVYCTICEIVVASKYLRERSVLRSNIATTAVAVFLNAQESFLLSLEHAMFRCSNSLSYWACLL